jgi:hypothetical protein
MESAALQFHLLPNLKHLLCFTSVMLLFEDDGANWGALAVLSLESFSIALMNFLRCLMYSGYVSRLQWPPPFTHQGSYFSFASSHSRLPWEKSTMSSAVPCITSTGQSTCFILSMFCRHVSSNQIRMVNDSRFRSKLKSWSRVPDIP